MSPAFPVAVLVTGCDSSLSRRQTGYQSSACHRGRERKAWEPSKQSGVPVSNNAHSETLWDTSVPKFPVYPRRKGNQSDGVTRRRGHHGEGTHAAHSS